ncbi:N-acetyltransferase [Methylobacterium goesingense]|uniref:N-acetyltransferase domain-containing protein n=1 Tax=Methylobacterium goesingense TaxID=243690 RepID=A0ABV2LDC5_9HYPH|nr:N-acetyltransferase [Methylobacterium goesingense]
MNYPTYSHRSVYNDIDLHGLKFRIKKGPYLSRTSIGMRRKLSDNFAPPSCPIPLVLRDFQHDDLQSLFHFNENTFLEQEKINILWRLEMVSKGSLISRCFVAADEHSGYPYHIQWLTEPGSSDQIRQALALPALGFGEALLENAYTPPRHRGLGIMPAAIELIAQHNANVDRQFLIMFIDTKDYSSLSAVKKSGLLPYTVRTWEQYVFGLFQRIRFKSI